MADPDAMHGLKCLWSKFLNIPLDGITEEDSLLSLGATSEQGLGIYGALQGPPWGFKFYPSTPFMSWTLKEHGDFLKGRFEKNVRDALLQGKEYKSEEKIPLSFPQEQIWFQLQDSTSPLIYNYSHVLCFPGKMNVKAMEASANLLIQRHRIIDTSFHEEFGKVFQRVKNYEPFSLPVLDLTDATSEAERLEHCQKHLAQNLLTPFNLETGPMYKWFIILMSPEMSILQGVVHHIVVDGTAAHITELELRASYAAFCKGRDPSVGILPPMQIQYMDFITWQRSLDKSGTFVQFSKFWKKYLENLTPLDLPRDGPRISSVGATASSLRFKWEIDVSQFAKEMRVTSFVILLSALKVLLGRYTKQNDVSILTAKHGRTNSKLRALLGHFTNSIVVRTCLRDNHISFKDLVRQIDITLTNIYENQEYPFQHVVQDLIQESKNGNLFQYLLFPVCIVMLPKVVKSKTGSGSPAELTNYLEVENNLLTHELTFYLEEGEGNLSGFVKYNSAIHSAPRIQQMVSNFETLLENCLAEPRKKIRDLDILKPSEIQRILEMGTGRQVPIQIGGVSSLVQLFEKQVIETPSNIAIIEGALKSTYASLNEESNILGESLEFHVEVNDDFIAILLPQSTDFIRTSLAVLKIGKVVVPLSVQNSVEYLEKMLQNLGSPLLVTTTEVVNSLGFNYNTKIFLLDQKCEVRRPMPRSGENRTQSRSTAYCIHTSGSTGFPKPVNISNDSLINHSNWAKEELGLSRADRVLVFNNISFDASLQDIWPFLLSGATLCIPPSDLKYKIDQLWDYISENGITCLTLPTAIADKALSIFDGISRTMTETPLRVLLIGGDYLHSWRPGLPFQVVNGYGLTECTIISTFVSLTEENYPSSGVPIWNTQVYVLDENLKLSPIGVSGEIYIGGAGISKYWNRDDLNDHRFIDCPFTPGDTGSCMYKTGDLGYLRYDGHLYIVGRMDNQVKVRGHRVEIGEIEDVLVSYEDIFEAVVILDEDSTSLSAFCRTNSNLPVFQELQTFLKQRLPYYAIPSQIFICSNDFPLTITGKIDKTKMGESKANAILLCPEFLPLEDDMEVTVSKIWAEVLGLPLDVIGREDNFFGLGGHSLLVADVLWRLQEEPLLGDSVNLQVEDLFKEPTVSGFAKVIKSKMSENKEQQVLPEVPSITATAKDTADEKIPLSFQQEQIWLHMQENSDCLALYNETFSLEFVGAFNEEATKRAIEIILKRHDILRSNYYEIDGEIFSKVDSADDPHPFSTKKINLSRLKLPKSYFEIISQKVLHTSHRKPFNLSKDILIRFTHLDFTPSLTRVQVIFHHLIMDAIGIITFEKELRALYNSGNQGQNLMSLSPLEFQYSDFALWQRQHFTTVPNSSEASKFWKEFLAGVEPVNLFPHKQRKLEKFSKESGSIGFNLSTELSEKVKEFCANQNTTPFVTLLSALKILIYRYSNQSDICIACTTSGRNAGHTRTKSLDTLIGYFVNVVIFRNDLSGSPSFEELVRRVHSNQNKVMEYQDYPFQNVVRDSGMKLGEDLYRLGVTMEPRNLKDSSFFFEQVDYHTKYEFTICFDESKTNYMLYLVFSRDIYAESEIEAFGSHFQALLEHAMESPIESIDKLNILSPYENKLVLDSFNQKSLEIPVAGPEVTLIQLFQEQVKKTPGNVAIVENGQELTYSELNSDILKLANYLSRCAGSNYFVGLLLPQCTEFIISTFAILKAGKICVPLSVDQPQRQLEYMLSEVGNPVLITNSVVSENTGLTSYAKVILVENWPELLNFPQDVAQPVPESISASAYCFFTSGSTGLPKAVIAEHSGIINVTWWLQQEYDVSSTDRTLLFTSPAFDGSLAEIWPFLTSGATVFIPPPDIRYNVVQLHAWVLEHKLTFVFRTTRLSEGFFSVDIDPGQPCSIKWLFCGGEPLHAYPPATLPYRVAFAYGSTETTILSTTNNLDRDGKGVPTIGFPISNVRVYVLDSKSLMPMPIGVPGEIFVGGIGVTPGYLNKEELNREKIIPDPYGKTPEAKMYRSGDLGYWIPEGELVILGRQDSQIKIRGIRVGLGQIEDALMQYPTIDQAIVSVRSDNNTLAAYCVGVKPVLNELTDFLRKLLPVYSIPSVFLFVPEFPITAVGKVDKKTLTEKAESEFDSCFQDHVRVPPATVEEMIVAQVWSEILKVPADGINRDDNFFSLGGHSLLVGAVVTRFQASPWFIDLRIGDLFKDPTVRSFALVVKAKLDGKGENSDGGVETNVVSTGMCKLSFQQEQIWFHMQETDDGSLYNETFSLNFTENLDLTLFRRALQMVINRHSILRTNFLEVDGNVVQIVKRRVEQNIPMLVVDISHLKNAYTKDMISRRLLFASQEKPFNLRSGRLFRLRLIKLEKSGKGRAGSVRYRLQVICHHLIIDAVGAVIFERELKTFYEMLQGNLGQNSENLLSPIEFQYSDFARRQRVLFNQEDDKSKNSRDFWMNYLSGLETVTLFPRRRPQINSDDSPSGVTGFIISSQSTQNIKTYCKEQTTTPFVVLMAALKVLIYRYTNQDDIFTLCTTDGRNQSKLDGLIGYFINNVIFRTDLSGHPSFTELVNRVQQTNNLVMAHQDYPFQQILADAEYSSSALKTGFYNLAVTMEPRNYRSLEQESAFYFEKIEPVTKFDLLICFDENEVNGGIQIGLLYNRNVYEDNLIQNFGKHFETLLDHLVNYPEESIGSFNFLSEEEIELSIVNFNEKNLPFEFQKGVSLAQLFLEQAGNPTAAPNVAIFSADGQEITYAELKSDALRVANSLHNTENEFVAILLPQSIEFVTMTLGILLARKICVPLSLDHPLKSLEFMLQDVGNPVLITTSKYLESTGLAYSGVALLLDNLNLKQCDTIEVNGMVYPTSAYCLFTSGSTGRPKPVLVEHSGILNTATFVQTECDITSTDRSLLACCPAFDLSLSEIWPFLLSGATLCIPPEEFRYSVPNLHTWVMENKITFAFLTTRLCEMFCQLDSPDDCSLKWLVTGGEALHSYPRPALSYNVLYGYGTTETCIFTTLNKLIPGHCDPGIPNNGSPNGNVCVYILDPYTHNPMPIGAVGEICIGGIGVSPGYLNRPQENELKFVPDPYNPGTMRTMYKSGDLGYWSESESRDGELVVIGRKDNQVKIRGVRIGLGQIEQVLQEYPNISQALVLLEETDTQKILSAFCVGSGKVPNFHDLLAFLNNSLPRNAVPSSFTFISSLPLNPVGKIDRSALLLKRYDVGTTILKSNYVPPSTVQEKLVAQIWSDILSIPIERISTQDNFFALGGHSLLLAECVQRLRVPPWNFQVNVSDLFGQSNLSEFAGKLVKSTRDSQHRSKQLAGCDRDITLYPLSFPQEQIMFHSQAQQVNRSTSASLYTVAFQIEFVGHTVNLSALNRSINTVLSRHKILMSTIHESEGKLHQKTHAPTPPFILQNQRCLDLRKLRGCAGVQNLIAKTIFRKHHLKASFKLEKGPLIRFTLLRFSESRVLVFGSCHHCVLDGLSVHVLESDLRRIYNGILENGSEYFSPAEIQYSDYVLWQRDQFGRTGLSDESLTFWRNYLAELIPLELRTDKPRSQNERKYKSAVFKFEISTELTRLVREFSKSHQMTSFITLMAVLKVLLFRYTNQSDIFLVSTTDGRSHPDFKNLIGHFINMILIRTTGLHSKLTFEQVIESVHESMAKVYKHQDSPLQNVVSQVGLSKSEVGLYRFGVTMTSAKTQENGADEGYLDDNTEFDSMYEIFLSINETSNQFQFLIFYDTDLYTNQRMEQFTSHFKVLLEQTMAARVASVTIGAFNLLNEQERQLVLYTFNDTKVETKLHTSSTISELFEEQVSQTPGNIAVMTSDGEEVTYALLNQMSESFKNRLQGLNEENKFVVILLPQSIELIAVTITILKCGKICVPINVDTLNPAILNVLAEVQNPLLITMSEILRSKELVYSRVICIDTDTGSIEDRVLPTGSSVGKNPIAYCLGTSGSTGSPKLTMVDHKGLINFMSWLHSTLELTSCDRLLMYSSPAFDLSLCEIWGSLLYGGTLCVPPMEFRYDLKSLKRWVNETKVTNVFFTTRVAEKFLALRDNDSPSSIRCLTMGGETFNSSVQIPESLPYKVFNGYGVMEASIMSTLTELTPNSTSYLHLSIIGKPISNVQVYILSEDENLLPVPVGVTGEICIGGVGVSPGYVNRPELNEQKFIPNPFSQTGMIYKTGDLGYWLPSGDIVIVGRRDDQIKIRGLRTNLLTVEGCLGQYPGVVQAVVLLESSETLIAYFTTDDEDKLALPSLNQITDFLRKLIPQFAIPSRFYEVSSIPLNNIGKVDKQELMAMKSTGSECKLLQTNVNPPRTNDEKLVAQVWSEVLHMSLEVINVEDNFFSLGGHSLLAGEIIHKLRVDPWNYDVKIADIFASPMLSDFAALLPSRKIGKASILPRANNPEYFPLSFAQEQVWMHLQDNQHSALYNIGFSLDFTGHFVDIDALRQSILSIVTRHEIFRVTIHEIGGIPRQKIHEMDQTKYLPIVHDLQDEDAQAHAQSSIAAEIFKTPFDLATGPLIKFHVLKMSPEFVKLLVFTHHCLMDGTSIQIFMKELKEYYNAKRMSSDYKLIPPPIQYMDYVVWQKESGIRSESMHFWKNYLDGLVPLELQTDYPRNTTRLTGVGCVDFTISPELSQLIREFSKVQKTTTFATLFSVFVVLIYRYTKQSDIFVVSPDNGRSHPGTQNLIGHFVNVLIIRVKDLSNDISFLDVIHSVHESITQVYLHADAPFQSVVAESGLNARQSSLFRLLITMAHTHAQTENALRTQGFENLSDIAPKGELGLVIQELSETFRFTISYGDPLYSAERMKRFAGHFEALLADTMNVGNSNIGIGRLKIMNDIERNTILNNFNTPIVHKSTNVAGNSLLKIFEAQVQRFPDKPVLFSEEEGYMTYRDLNDSAAKLCRKIRQKFPAFDNDFVSILLPTGKHAVVSIIAIHKLGGTCVPINIRFPVDQIKSMLEDIGNPLMLTTRKDFSNIQDVCARASALFVEDCLAEPGDNTDALIPLTTSVPNSIPYGLFTSGSTGRPKLVLVTETSIMNLANWMQSEFNLTADEKALQFYSPATDAFLGAFWPNVASGGTIYIPPDEMHYDIDALWKWVRDKEITFVGLPTASAETFYSIRDVDGENAPNLVRHLLCGGEMMKIYPPSDLPYTVVNCYGLTETGVISTFARVTSRDALAENRPILIGKAIRNTQIFILDENSEPVPIGISGELFIGGDGIAKGYFQNDTLNEQKFVPNPFDNSELLFRTGDLGYWLPDGNISLTGRSDNLVKIRSHRIELDEIEVSLLKYPNIKQAAVLIEKDEEDEQFITAFCAISTSDNLSYTPLYNFLGDRLPYYALPTSIYVLPILPLNSNGKIDRKLLPSLKSDSAKLQKSTDAIKNPPETSEEIAVAEIWSKILNIPIDSISRNDNFFMLGGNSLLLAQIIFEFNSKLSTNNGSDLTVSAVFANPTVEALAKHFETLLGGSEVVAMATDFAQEIILDIDINRNLDKSAESGILLTGATGYLGAGLLVELLARTDTTIFCLIRDVDKLEACLAPYGLVLTERIICIIGDLAKPNFGLAVEDYSKLAVNVGAIYHCGAEVHFLKTYEELRPTNVMGTKEIIKFATTSCLKTIHYISTLGVFSSRLEDSNNNIDRLDEISLNEVNIDPHTFTSGYGKSKWVAEKLVWAGIAKGLPAIVYRLGEIGCHGKLDLYNRSDMVAMILASCGEIGYLPQMNGIIPYGNLDFCASAVIRISLGENNIPMGNQVYHIVDYTFTFQELFQVFSSYKKIPIIPLMDWEIKFKEFLSKPDTSDTGSLTRGQSAILSLLLTKKEFKFPSNFVTVTPTVKFLRTKIAIEEPPEKDSVLKELEMQRYIQLITG